MYLTLHSFSLKLCSATIDLKHSALHYKQGSACTALHALHCTVIMSRMHCSTLYVLNALHGTELHNYTAMNALHCTTSTTLHYKHLTKM